MHGAYYMLQVAWCMLHDKWSHVAYCVACYMLQGAWCMLHVTCCTVHVTCYMSAWSMVHVTCCMFAWCMSHVAVHVTCCMLHGASYMLHDACMLPDFRLIPSIHASSFIILTNVLYVLLYIEMKADLTSFKLLLSSLDNNAIQLYRQSIRYVHSLYNNTTWL